MRTFWILIILVVLGGTAYVYRAELAPHLPAQIAAYIQPAGGKPAASADAASAGKSSGKRGGGPVTVKVAIAKSGDLPVLRDSFGYISARDTTSLTSPVAGVVTDIKVQNGTEVKAGDVLVTYDTRALEAALAKDQATLAKDQATYDNAVVTMKRTADLGVQGASTQQATDNAKAALEQAQAALTLDRAQIEADKVAISNAQVIAPYDGKLGIISVSKGAYVGAGSAVGTIVDINHVYAQFTLSEADLQAVREAFAKGELNVAVQPTNATDGTRSMSAPVTFIDNQVDQASGTFRLWALLDNSSRIFWPGESISAKATVGFARNVVMVPNAAIAPQQKGMAAYVVSDDGKAHLRIVTVALRSDGTAGVTDGIKAGEKVIIEGQQSVTDGAAVKIEDGAGASGSKAEGSKKKPDVASADETGAAAGGQNVKKAD